MQIQSSTAQIGIPMVGYQESEEGAIPAIIGTRRAIAMLMYS